MKPLPFLLVLCLLASPHLASAKGLGRLFFTPEQRQLLDSGRLRASAANDPSSATVVVNGIVQKHGGKRTVWINGVPQAAGPSNENNPATTPVTVPGKSRPVQLKVGQKLLLDQHTTTPTEPEGAK